MYVLYVYILRGGVDADWCSVTVDHNDVCANACMLRIAKFEFQCSYKACDVIAAVGIVAAV